MILRQIINIRKLHQSHEIHEPASHFNLGLSRGLFDEGQSDEITHEFDMRTSVFELADKRIEVNRKAIG